LLAISSLSSEFAIAFREGVCYISRQRIGSQEIPLAQLQRGLWRLYGSPMTREEIPVESRLSESLESHTMIPEISSPAYPQLASSSLLVTIVPDQQESSEHLWHQRLGHLHYSAVRSILNYKTPHVKPVCDVCVRV